MRRTRDRPASERRANRFSLARFSSALLAIATFAIAPADSDEARPSSTRHPASNLMPTDDPEAKKAEPVAPTARRPGTPYVFFAPGGRSTYHPAAAPAARTPRPWATAPAEDVARAPAPQTWAPQPYLFFSPKAPPSGQIWPKDASSAPERKLVTVAAPAKKPALAPIRPEKPIFPYLVFQPKPSLGAATDTKKATLPSNPRRAITATIPPHVAGLGPQRQGRKPLPYLMFQPNQKVKPLSLRDGSDTKATR